MRKTLMGTRNLIIFDKLIEILIGGERISVEYGNIDRAVITEGKFVGFLQKLQLICIGLMLACLCVLAIMAGYTRDMSLVGVCAVGSATVIFIVAIRLLHRITDLLFDRVGYQYLDSSTHYLTIYTKDGKKYMVSTKDPFSKHELAMAHITIDAMLRKIEEQSRDRVESGEST